MNGILTDEMLQEIFTALQNGETYGYADENMTVQASPKGISIQYKSVPKVDTKEKEVTEFLRFCDSIHEDLFVEVCETFEAGELAKLQHDLDTDNYKNTIKVFSSRIGEVANSRLAEIMNDADAEIRRQEIIIKNAQSIIDDIHSELDAAYAKYSL